MAVRRELKQFCETTTVKGVSRVAKSDSKVSKLLWTSAVVFGASFAIFQLSSLFITYYSYNVNIIVEEQRVHPAFPDVTICNLNPLNSAKGAHLSFDEYLEALDILDQRWVNEYMFSTTTRKAYAESFSHLASLTGYFQNMELPDADNNDPRLLDNLIISCKFYRWDWSIDEDLDCLLNATEIFWDPSYNYCATLTVADIDPNNEIRGLTLISYISTNSEVTAPSFTHNLLHSKSMGLMVSVHPPLTLPDLRNGMMVSPGHETTIHVTVRERFLSGFPYGDCQPVTMNDYYRGSNSSRRNWIRYGQTQCESICQQKHIRDTCSCLTPGFFAPSHFFDNTSYCGNFSISEMAAALRDHMDENDQKDWNDWQYDFMDPNNMQWVDDGGQSDSSGNPDSNADPITSDDNTLSELYNYTQDILNEVLNNTQENGTDLGNNTLFNDILTTLINYTQESQNNELLNDIGNHSSDMGNYTMIEDTLTTFNTGAEELTTSSTTVNGSDGANNTQYEYEFVTIFGSSEYVLRAFNSAINKLNCVTSSDVNIQHLHCDCPTACQSVDYALSQSQSPWPHHVYQPAFFCKYIKHNPALLPHFKEYNQITECGASKIKTDYSYMYEYVDKIRQNFLQLNVKMSYSKKTVYKDTPALTWDTLFSNIGGTLNLWIGVTFMTLIEVVELILHLIGGVSCTCGERKNKVTSISEETDSRA